MDSKFKRFIYSILFLFFTPFCFANASPSITHILYITFDGTRWQDFFDKQAFPLFWKNYASKVTIYGAPSSNDTMNVASIPVSLPSYQSQMSGDVQPCDENGCGRIHVETLPEELVHRAHFAKQDVVTFSSWDKIKLAVEHIPGTTLTYTGNHDVKALDAISPDSFMAAINAKQLIDHPVEDPEDGPERYDRYTFSQALHYYELNRPKFMWMSFVDADEAAHNENINEYNNALHFYDQVLQQVFQMIAKLHADNDTMIIVTTDHGRGSNKSWVDHGPDHPESTRTWAFVYNGKLTPIADDGDHKHYTTLSIRPTIEKIVGIYHTT